MAPSTLTTSGAAIRAAGLNANSDIISSGAAMASFSDLAEGFIEAETNTNWVSNYSTLSTSSKNALSQVASALWGNMIVRYDPTGYLAREADAILNLNDDIVTKGLSALRGKADRRKAP